MEKVSNIIPYFRKELNHLAHDREILSWAYLSIESLLGFNRSDCIIYEKEIVNRQMVNKFKHIVMNLKLKMPLQYILGETTFCNFKLKVNKHALIPRPETEELVDWILEEDFKSALDIGTGSGCIAIALARYSNATVSAIDFSIDALELAKENALSHNVKVMFTKQDVFQLASVERVDLIVSNPPYVLNSEKDKMDLNVLNYEPHSALFVPDEDPLIFYKHIINLSSKSLTSEGKLFFEINENFSNELINILGQTGFVDIELKKDINDKDRMVKAIWK